MANTTYNWSNISFNNSVRNPRLYANQEDYERVTGLQDIQDKYLKLLLQNPDQKKSLLESLKKEKEKFLKDAQDKEIYRLTYGIGNRLTEPQLAIMKGLDKNGKAQKAYEESLRSKDPRLVHWGYDSPEAYDQAQRYKAFLQDVQINKDGLYAGKSDAELTAMFYKGEDERTAYNDFLNKEIIPQSGRGQRYELLSDMEKKQLFNESTVEKRRQLFDNEVKTNTGIGQGYYGMDQKELDQIFADKEALRERKNAFYNEVYSQRGQGQQYFEWGRDRIDALFNEKEAQFQADEVKRKAAEEERKKLEEIQRVPTLLGPDSGQNQIQAVNNQTRKRRASANRASLLAGGTATDNQAGTKTLLGN